MSPRSKELADEARARLRGARANRELGEAAIAASAAYYAMLYAARAALSERGRYAKTHSGTWALFAEQFVATGAFDRELAGRAGEAQRIRELGDYEAKPPSAQQAEELVDVAGRFVDAVMSMLDE